MPDEVRPNSGTSTPNGDSQPSLLTQAADAREEGQRFLYRLSEEERNVLTAQFPLQRLARDSVVFREGEQGQTLFIIWQGRVAILKEQEDATFALLTYRATGDIVGEMGIIGQRPRSASVVTVEDTVLIEISGEDFLTLVTAYPGIAMALLNVLSDRLQAADEVRTTIAQESFALSQRLRALASETEHLITVSQLRQDTIDLIVHDLRNPLSVIKASLELLGTTLPATSLQEQKLVELARTSADRLLQMVESLLEAARQEHSGISLVRDRTALPPLIEAAVDSVRSTAEQNGLALDVTLPADFPEALVDVEKLQRVVINLLDNAIAYTPDAGTITVDLETAGEVAVVSITDTGPGVPDAHRERIFERFGRVPGTRGRRRGFGLGLYFCRQVVEAHGGRIWVESGPKGIGSRFRFTLPLPP